MTDHPVRFAEKRQASATDPPPAEAAQRRLTVDISGAAVVKIVIGLLALGIIGGLLSQMREMFVWTLTAMFLAIALNPLVVRLEPRFGRRTASTVVFVGFVVGFIAVLIAFVAPFVTQVDKLSTAIPQAISDAQHNSAVQRLDQRFHIAAHAKQHSTRCRTSSLVLQTRFWVASSPSRRSSSSRCSCFTSCRPSAT